MSPAVAEELRLAHAANTVERNLADEATRRVNAAALQRALFRHRDDIIRLVEDHQALQDYAAALRAGLEPFARVASALAPGQNPVLFSIPVAGGRDWIQLRPAHFRRAADLLEIQP